MKFRLAVLGFIALCIIGLTAFGQDNGKVVLALFFPPSNNGAVTSQGTISGTPLAAFVNNNPNVISAANVGDVVALFSGCSGIQYLGADGNCHTAGSGTPGGSNGAVQGNISNAFAAVPNFTFNTGTGALTTTSSLTLDYANFPNDSSHTCNSNDIFFSNTGIPVAGVGTGDCERLAFPPVFVNANVSPFTDPGGQNDSFYNATGGALTVTLPDGLLSDGGSKPVSQIERCYSNPVGATGVITVNTLASPANTVYLYGVSQGSASPVVSGGALGDTACFFSLGNHHWQGLVLSGTWNGVGPPGGGGGTPGSPSLSVQGNSGGSFVGIPGFAFVAANGALTAQPTADVVPLTIKCFASGANDCLDIVAADGSTTTKFQANGNFVFPGITFTLGSVTPTAQTSQAHLTITGSEAASANNNGAILTFESWDATQFTSLIGPGLTTSGDLCSTSTFAPSGDCKASVAGKNMIPWFVSGTNPTVHDLVAWSSTQPLEVNDLAYPSLCSAGQFSQGLSYSSGLSNNCASGAVSLDQVTGSAAQQTATETAAGHNITEAGVETAALTYPFVFTNANSTNNNTSGALIIQTTGTSTGAVPLLINEAAAAGNFVNFINGGTVTNGTESGGTSEFSVSASGAVIANSTITSGQSINSVGMESNTATGSIKIQSGNDTNTATTAGLLTLRGHDITAGSTANSKGGNVLIRGGNDAGSIASALAGGVFIMAGAETGATQGVQGNTAIGTVYIKGATSTQWKVQQITSTNTVQDAAISAVAGIVGVAEVVNTNSVQVLFEGQTFVVATAAVTVGHNVCMGATAGEVTDSSTGCAVGTKVGVVLDIANAHTLADGTSSTATSTQPWIQIGLN